MTTQPPSNTITPAEALARLQAGNDRFAANRRADHDFSQRIRQTSGGQSPFAAVLGCIDSRVPPEIVFDQGLGDIFSVRVAGNVLNADVIGSLEFACQMVGTPLVVVLGHTNCGAIIGACDGVKLGHLTGLLSKIKPALDAATIPMHNRHSQNAAFVQQVTDAHIAQTVAALSQRSHVLRALVDTGKVVIVGAIYDVETGRVTFR